MTMTATAIKRMAMMMVAAMSRPRRPLPPTASIIRRLSTTTSTRSVSSPDEPTTNTTTNTTSTNTTSTTSTSTMPDVQTTNSTAPSTITPLSDATATNTTTHASSISFPDTATDNSATSSIPSPDNPTTAADTTAPAAAADENADTVRALHELGVRVTRVRKLHGWVLRERRAHVRDTAELLVSLGVAPGGAVAALLERCPAAVLCPPADAQAQRRLWLSLCDRRDEPAAGPGVADGGGGGGGRGGAGGGVELANVVQRFPETFFLTASPEQRANQQDNIALLLSAGLHRRVLARLLAAAPQLFCRPAADNGAAVAALHRFHRSLGGSERDARAWLAKLLSQDAHALAGDSPERLAGLAALLRRRLALSDRELLRVATGVRGSPPAGPAIGAVLRFCRSELGCDDADEEEGDDGAGGSGGGGDAAVRRVLLACPTLLSFPAEILAENLKVLLSLGASLRAVRACPSSLELTAPIVRHRASRLRAAGCDVARGGGALSLIAGTRREFEDRLATLGHTKARPLFNPVAPPPDAGER
ncbi:transcription termination factor 2, mitochondrial [Lethenteron reissneri]|uniref:transcription termination factor 2, mitochondrial n=1 Tax=Lethenteron reissneri TaxID=7753 RepID=UPI002AB62B0B|nr:transcription termination factor 2, mitochondrial [Lethenteron reissneri]XP_061420311.1 transcription termination factor 2, mitochondrial [Lethenteron reissneri]XP_061420312.1 transcription termination factor 2, mitochondrial [Lethenteron reissneri]